MRIRDIISESSPEFIEQLQLFVGGPGFHKMPHDWRHDMIRVFDDNMKILNKSYTLFRGWSLKSWDELDEKSDFRNNSIISYDGYLSASTNPKVARREMVQRPANDGHTILIEFKIHTKPSVKGIVVNDYITWADEGEIILNRDSQFKVINIHHDKFQTNEDDRNDSWLKNASWNIDDLEHWKVELEQIK